MTYFFFDSSALIKRYVTEKGTSWVREISTNPENRVFVAQITAVEIVSALARRNREGGILPRTAQAARLLVDRHFEREYRVLKLSDQIIKRAEDLLSVYPLRAYDAVQLATALEANALITAARLPSLMFVSADQRLLSAANSERLLVLNPTDQT